MRLAILYVLLAASLPAFAKEEGSCDQTILRNTNIAFAKIEGFTDEGSTVEFVEACTKSPRSIKKCAIAKSEKRELQKACFPKDGSPDYFESAYRVEYYEERDE